jgi:hypothetical protein
MADEGKGFWQSMPGFLTGVAAVIAAVTGLMVAMKPTPAATGVASGSGGGGGVQSASTIVNTKGAGAAQLPPHVPLLQPPKRPMGNLQYGVGYDHNDIDANGWQSVTTPQACSDLCYEKAECKAMTYVESNRSCWLKFKAANRVSVANEVSALKE